MKRFMNYLRTPKHRIIAAIVLTVLLAISYNATAADPQVKYKTSYGFMFDVNGTEMFCARKGDGVSCFTQDMTYYTCKYHEPPKYFSDCVRDEE